LVTEAAEKYKIITEKFEGPLDLLLHLINKERIDIYDIPVAAVTEQYLAYIFAMREFDMDIASEFLVMAAMLLQIKSRLLLPKQAAAQEEAFGGEEESDPKQALTERLVNYRRFKFMGEKLAGLLKKNSLFATRKPLVVGTGAMLPGRFPVERLLAAIISLLGEKSGIDAYIHSDEFNVQDKIADILSLLKIKGGALTLKETLIRSGSAGELVAAFLAALELLRTGLIKITQPEKFGAIYLYAGDDKSVLR
jgi:segregation and condensation protein A